MFVFCIYANLKNMFQEAPHDFQSNQRVISFMPLPHLCLLQTGQNSTWGRHYERQAMMLFLY